MGTSQATKRGTSRSRDRLNLIALGVVLGGLSVPFTMQTPVDFVKNTQSMFAGSATTLSAMVPANPYNTLAQQLADKEQELNDREAMLAEREAKDVGLSAGGIFGVLSFVFSLVLLILIGLNFYLDSRRSKKPTPPSNKLSVDLRN